MNNSKYKIEDIVKFEKKVSDLMSNVVIIAKAGKFMKEIKLKNYRLEPKYKILSRDKKGQITNAKLEEISFIKKK